jgi:aspartate aminotransferase-like enzyme
LHPKPLLMIPGPTPVPAEVLQALSTPMMNHRGPEYQALQRECIAGLKQLFQTEGDVLIFPAAGTGGLEAAVTNTLSPGDAALHVTVGVFGERFGDIARAFGCEVTTLAFPYGQAADPDAVARALGERDYKAVLVTHNETSTGVTNDLETIARVVQERGLLLLVDGISSMLATDLQTDHWGCDVVVGGSQKAWMLPPGLTFVSVGDRAWEAHGRARCPRFYFDFAKMRKSMERDQTPYTPALPLLFGLRVALRLLLEEGLTASFARHQRVARATRAGVQALGLELFAAESHRSPSLTSVRPPEGITPRQLRAAMRERGVVIAGGQGKMEDQLFRIGHLGYVSEIDILATLAALELTLNALDRPVPLGTGVAAAQAMFAADSE